MIHTAKGTIANNSFYFLLWGWVSVIGNLGHYILLKYTAFEAPYSIWLISIPAAIVSFTYGYIQGKNARVKTYSSNVTFWVWMCFMVNLVLLLIFMNSINYNINPLIMMFAAMATFLSGIVLKFKPLKIGGILFWILAIVAFLSSYENQMLIAAISLVTGYLIPGYMLKNRSNNG